MPETTLTKTSIVVSLLLITVLSTVALTYCITRRRSPFAISNISSSLEEAGAKIGQLAKPKKKNQKGELLDLRAIEPTPYDGNAASLTTTMRATAHTPSGSLSSTFTSSRLSRKTRHTSHTTSIITLPVDFIHSSPLRLNSIATDNMGQLPTSPRPGTGRLRRWEIDNVHSRPSTANSKLERVLSLSSPTSLFPAPPVSSNPPQLDSPVKDFRASFMSILPHIDSEDHVRMRPGPVIKKPVSFSARSHTHETSSSVEEPISLTSPPPVHRRGDHPFFGGVVPQRTLSKSTAEPKSVMNRLRGDSGELGVPLDRVSIGLTETLVKRKRDSRVLSALRDWGTAVFMEIDKTLEDTRSITTSPNKEYQSSQLSSASSTYSLHDGHSLDVTPGVGFDTNDNKSSNSLPRTGAVSLRSIGKAKETMVNKAPPLPPKPAPPELAPLHKPEPPAGTNPFESNQSEEESKMPLPSHDTPPQVFESQSRRSGPEAQPQPQRPPSLDESQKVPPPRFSQRYTRRFETSIQ